MSKDKRGRDQTIANDADSDQEEIFFDEQERKEREFQKQIDSMYLINNEEDEELFIFKGLGSTSKVKTKQNQETFAVLKSPYIPQSAEELESINNDSNGDLDGVNEQQHRADAFETIGSDGRVLTERGAEPTVQVDEGLY